jgi:L-iditol 2-dehydrogenase
VRIRIGAALTCGTDLKVFKRGYHAKMLVPPTVFGHELAGTVVEVQSSKFKVQGLPWSVGDRVVVANSAPCEGCDACERDQHGLCDDLLFLNGAYAESIVVPARLVEKNLLRLQPGTTFRDAALTEPLACVVQGIEETQLAAGQRVLVIGAGPIGLMFVALARHLGCEVAVAGRGEARLSAARRLGASEVFDVGPEGDSVKAVTARRPRPDFDAVIEAVGKPEAWEAAVKLVRKGGTVNFFGGCPAGTSVSLDTGLIHYSNLTLRASFHHTPRTIRRALAFIESGVIRATDFVDGECALSELPALFARMTAGNRVVKTLVDVTR